MKQTNKQTDTDADEISTASLRGGNKETGEDRTRAMQRVESLTLLLVLAH